MIACIGALFCVFSYIFLFYPLLYLHHKKKSAKKLEYLIIRSKFSLTGSKSESICIYLRVFLRTIIHSTLIEHYETQMILLILVDIFAILVTYNLQSGFSSKLCYYCFLFYTFFFFILDIMFFIDYLLHNDLDQQKYDMLILIIICILVSLFLLISLKLLLIPIQKTCKKLNSMKAKVD